jgi:hypothetical protein
MQVGVLGQCGGTAERGGNGADRRSALDPAGLSAAGGAPDLQDWRAKQIREWLLLLLRFAITRDPEDELAASIMAEGIDSLGRLWGKAVPTFFRRSSNEVCQAIRAPDDPAREPILKTHIRRIEQPELRRAFQAAVHFEHRGTVPFARLRGGTSG